MNHKWNLTEMLTVPKGNRNLGHYSVTDSQFLFGSQFWPENSQAASQSVSLSSCTSTTTSQEEGDATLLRNYQSKPLLFVENKEKNTFFNLLDQFEEDKKKAKENSVSETLATECVYIRETLNKIHQLAIGTEKSTAVCPTVLEKIEHFVARLENDLISLQSDISLRLQTLLNTVNLQIERIAGLEDKMEKTGSTTTELSCSVQSLKSSVEVLKNDQQSERDMLKEALKLLSTLVSKDSSSHSLVKVTDSIIQTSPSLAHSLSGSLQENQLENTQPNAMCKAAPSQHTRQCLGTKKNTKRFPVKRKRRPLLMSQKRKPVIVEENSPSLLNSNKQPLSEWNNENESRSFFSPLSCWSQDSQSSTCLNGIDPILDETEPTEQPGGLWQLFEENF